MKLTIVITTFNRPDYIKRHLTFLDLNRCIYDIIILDGSNKNNQIKNSNTIHKLKHINVIHRTYPEDMNCAFRIKMGLREISSPYTLLFADDDFILTSALADCISFLDENPEFSSCVGRVPCLFVTKKFFKIPMLAMFNFLGNNYSISFKSPHKRLISNDALTPVGHPPLFYSIKRTNVTKEAFEYADPDTQYSAMERVFNSYTLIKGKHKVLNKTFAFRDYQSTPIVDQWRDGTAVDSAYISGTSESKIITFFKLKGITPDLIEYIYPEDKNYVGDPENVKNPNQLLPTLRIAKAIQYILNLFTNYYLKHRFEISLNELKHLKKVI